MILAIETGIIGGSVALLADGAVISEISGDRDVSRAEELLPQIEELITANGRTFSDIEMIAVSLGPGSYTGIRIGISSVLGMRRVLNIPCKGISALQAIALANIDRLPGIITVPASKSEIAMQSFDVDGVAVSEAEVVYAKDAGEAIGENSVISLSEDNRATIASAIGSAIYKGYGSDQLTPIYLRNKIHGVSLF